MGRAPLIASLLLAAVLAPMVARADTVSCPNTATTSDREFNLTTTPGATCLTSGNGNNLNGGGADPVNALGYLTLDSSADGSTGLFSGGGGILAVAGIGTASGSFSFTAPAGYTNFVVGFQASTAGINPDYAAFLLPAGILTGTWSIATGGTSPLGTVDRIIVYGQPVPLPPAALLLASGLVGLAALRRRRVIPGAAGTG